MLCYNIKYVMLYNMFHVMLHIKCHVMKNNMYACCVKSHLSSYVI